MKAAVVIRARGHEGDARLSDSVLGVLASLRQEANSRATPPSPSTPPIAEDERAKFEAWFGASFYGSHLEVPMLMAWLARAALSSRPAGEVELPPLPPKKVMGYDAFDMAQYARAYGEKCARAALASKAAARKEPPCGS